MTRRDWWIGILLIVGGLVVHAAVPRYEWRSAVIRIDRWTGRAERGQFVDGHWRGPRERLYIVHSEPLESSAK